MGDPLSPRGGLPGLSSGFGAAAALVFSGSLRRRGAEAGASPRRTIDQCGTVVADSVLGERSTTTAVPSAGTAGAVVAPGKTAGGADGATTAAARVGGSARVGAVGAGTETCAACTARLETISTAPTTAAAIRPTIESAMARRVRRCVRMTNLGTPTRAFGSPGALPNRR